MTAKCRWCRLRAPHKKWQWCRRCLVGVTRVLVEIEYKERLEGLDRNSMEYLDLTLERDLGLW